MKYLITLFVLFCFISIVGATDLAELAKKEKARREALAKQGKKPKTLTNADVANLKSPLGIEVKKSGEVAGKTPAEQAQSESASSSAEEKNKDIEEQIKKYREEIEKLKKETEEQRSGAAAGGGSHSVNIGTQYGTIRESEELVEDLEQDIADLEAEKEKE